MLTKVAKKCTPFYFTETLKLIEILSANAQHLRFALNAHFRRTLERVSEEVLSASSDGSTATEKKPDCITCDNLHHSELRVFWVKKCGCSVDDTRSSINGRLKRYEYLQV